MSVYVCACEEEKTEATLKMKSKRKVVIFISTV